MKLRRALAVLALSTVVGSVAIPTPAHAADSWDLIVSTTDDNPGGRMWVAASGDVVQVCDVQADGKRAVASVYNPGGSLRYRFTASGVGTCNTKGASNGGAYNLVEGTSYKFQVCLTDDTGALKFCQSAWTAA